MTTLVVDGGIDGYGQATSTGAALLVNGTTVFTVAGGPILITHLLSYVIVGGDSTAATLQWSATARSARPSPSPARRRLDQPCGRRRRLLQLHGADHGSGHHADGGVALQGPTTSTGGGIYVPAGIITTGYRLRPDTSRRPTSTSCAGFRWPVASPSPLHSKETIMSGPSARNTARRAFKPCESDRHLSQQRHGVTVGKLPAGRSWSAAAHVVTTAFNDSGTDTLIVGFIGSTTDDNAYATLLDCRRSATSSWMNSRRRPTSCRRSMRR
jgi:hypothetical protein